MKNLKRKTEMKKNIFNKSMVAAALLLMSASAYSQSSGSAYFLEGYSQRYQLNPAFAPDRSTFIAFPILSNIQVDAKGSVGLSHFMFNSTSHPGMLTTFMSSDVDAKSFLNALPDAAQFNIGLNIDLLSFGFGNENGFTTINFKLRNAETVSIPKDLFGFMKASMSQGNYLIKDINVNTNTYAEFSVTRSQKITDNITIGVGLKLLEGLAYADLNIDEIDARISEEEWKVKTNGTMRASVPGAKFKTKPVEGTDKEQFDGFDGFSFSAPVNLGFAVDLGVEYDFKGLVDGLKASAAVTDLGFINWSNVYDYATDNSEYVTFTGFNNYDVTSDNGSDDTMDKMKEDFKDMIRLYAKTSGGKENIMLNATLRAGVEYQTPFAEWLSFGELLTYRTGVYPYKESRTSMTLSPCKWFDLSGNVALTSMGNAMGVLLNLHPNGMNFFIAVDHLKAKLNPQMIPLEDFGVNFNMGLSFVFGDKRN